MQRCTHLAAYLVIGAALSLTTCKKSQPQTTTQPQVSAQEPAFDPTAAPANVAEPPANAHRTPSGLASVVLKPGTGGEKPQVQDRVKVHYTGWTKQGAMFDTSHTRSLPATFALARVIKGWTEGLQLMVPGEKRRFWIPADLAYGENPSRPGTPAGQLTFDIELLQVIQGAKPPPIPSDVATPPERAQGTKSGLRSVVLKPPAKNEPPGPYDRVHFHYTGWTAAGEMFDSSASRKTPAAANLSQIKPEGLKEALSLMSVGETRRVWIPAALAHEGPETPSQPSGQLTYELAMIRIVRLPPPPPVPPDVKAPPANAKRTASGLAYRLLRKGSGTTHPQATSTVEVRYTGWTPDGTLFDSSMLRASNAVFRLDRVIKGWTEGVQLMTEGGQARFWIPGDLAYGDEPREGAPTGMLVFDIELIKIRKLSARGATAGNDADIRTETTPNSTAALPVPPARNPSAPPPPDSANK